MNFSIRDLEACLAVAELKNFSRAAERCHVSQSAGHLLECGAQVTGGTSRIPG